MGTKSDAMTVMGCESIETLKNESTDVLMRRRRYFFPDWSARVKRLPFVVSFARAFVLPRDQRSRTRRNNVQTNPAIKKLAGTGGPVRSAA